MTASGARHLCPDHAPVAPVTIMRLFDPAHSEAGIDHHLTHFGSVVKRQAMLRKRPILEALPAREDQDQCAAVARDAPALPDSLTHIGPIEQGIDAEDLVEAICSVGDCLDRCALQLKPARGPPADTS